MDFPEILAPCGNFEMAKAAAYSGAKAIYIGVPGFNARGRTHDHSLEELRDIISFCHSYGTKVFFAMNIVFFEKELQVIAPFLKQIVALGADAFIVQDVGLICFIKKMAPDQIVHGSTQMTTTSVRSIELFEDLDVKRFVLSRELDLEKISSIRKNTTKELEVFVHGALCVAYSGQCLTSESFGGRSANRGQCAQSCRLDYKLIVDDKEWDTKGQPYLFSPQDLCGLKEVKTLKEMGIESLKIEGRLKSPEYVASAVQEYAKELESKVSNKERLASTYSRGMYPGWFHGVKHQELVMGEYSSNKGIYLGRVKNIKKNQLRLISESQIEAGDGIEILSLAKNNSIGTVVFFTEQKGNVTQVTLDRKKDWTWVKEGFKVFRNHSPKILKEINSTISPTDTKNKKLFSIDISFTSIGNVNVKIHYAQKTTNCISEIRITESEKKLDTNYFKKEISRLSRTDYVLDRFKCENLLGFIPGKSIRKLKTEILNQLKLIDTAISPPAIVCENPYQNLASLDKQKSTKSKLIVLVRREWQIDALETLNVDTIYMDFEFGRQYKTGLAKIRSFGKKAGIATLRVHKEGDDVHLKMIQRLAPDVVLVRNPGALHFFQNSNLTLVGDYSLNITNSMSFEYFQSKNLERILPSYDLNAEQLEDLLNVVDGKNIEVNIHHYMPAFHMEHCVFAKYLSDGNSWKDCGKPCEKHKVEVVDHKGESHFLATDHECRNTMFRGKPQSSLKLKSLYLNNSIEYFRIECLHESAEDVFAKVKTYSDWIEGHLTEKDVMEQIDAEEKYGVAAGQLFNFQNFVDRKKTTN